MRNQQKSRILERRVTNLLVEGMLYLGILDAGIVGGGMLILAALGGRLLALGWISSGWSRGRSREGILEGLAGAAR